MAHAIVFFNADNYPTYDKALADGATYATASTIDATENLTGMLDTIELLTACNTCLNDDAVDLACGVIHKGIWVSLDAISARCESRNSGMTPDMAIIILYNELKTVTLTFTLDEIKELTHRINMNTLSFTNAYNADNNYSPLNPVAKTELFDKLSAHADI